MLAEQHEVPVWAEEPAKPAGKEAGSGERAGKGTYGGVETNLLPVFAGKGRGIRNTPRACSSSPGAPGTAYLGRDPVAFSWGKRRTLVAGNRQWEPFAFDIEQIMPEGKPGFQKTDW